MLLLAACSETRRRSVDVHVDRLPEWQLREVRRIGSLDDPDLGFSSIGSVDVDENGDLYVLERQAPEVRVYGRTGQVLRRMGRSGDGPGEFRSPVRMGLYGDTVWVVDRSNRVVLFTRSGRELTTYQPVLARVEAYPGVTVELGAFDYRRDGTITSAWMVPRPAQPVTDSFYVPWVRLNTAGTILDTLSLQRLAFSQSERIEVFGRRVPAPEGPRATRLHVAAPDGAFLIERPIATEEDAAVFTVTRITTQADTVFHREFRYEPVPFSDEFVDDLAGQTASSWVRYLQLEAENLVGPARNAINLPEFQPPVSEAQLASDGQLWIRRQDNLTPRIAWLVISPDGEALANVHIPRGVEPLWMSTDFVWASSRDEFDVPWLIGYQVE